MSDNPPTPQEPEQPTPPEPRPNLAKPAANPPQYTVPPSYVQQGPPATTYYPPVPPYNPYAPVSDSQRLSGLSLAGFIVAVTSPLLYWLIVPAPVGLVLSIIGLVRDVHGRGMRGKGFAIAGIVISSVVIAIALLIIIGLIAYGVSHPEGSSGYCDMHPYSAVCDSYSGTDL